MARSNAFAALDVEDSGRLSSEDERPSSPKLKSAPASAKKAKAKKRQRERSNKGSTISLAANHGSDAESTTSSIPPVPSIKLEDKTDQTEPYSEAAKLEENEVVERPVIKTEAVDEVKEEPKTNGVATNESSSLSAPSMAPSFSADSATTEYENETPFDYGQYDETAGEETDVETQQQQPPRTPRAAQRFFQEPPARRRGSSATERAKSPPPALPEKEQEVKSPETPVPNHGSDHAPNKKRQAIITRTVATLAMVAGFFVVLYLGHIPMMFLILFLQISVFRELVNLFDAGTRANSSDAETPVTPARALRRAKRDRWARGISWYFFSVSNYFLYGETVIYYFKHIINTDIYFVTFVRHHRLISVSLWMVGFIGFVASLDRNAVLKRQFSLFGWIHLSMLLILGSSHFIVNNILEGLIWFWVPASLVIMNDVAAYICGMAFGRHQLIKLSPKKTVEGFVGAIFATLLFAFVWSTIFMRFNFMICPARELGVTASSHITCDINPAFAWHELPLPALLSKWLSTATGRRITTVPWSPFQLHSLVLAIFASLAAPFGGFFASGFKRAYDIKDFGDSIPGHGGLTDRMDCQFLMGMFTYFYYSSFCRPELTTIAAVYERATSQLTSDQIGELVTRLQTFLKT